MRSVFIVSYKGPEGWPSQVPLTLGHFPLSRRSPAVYMETSPAPIPTPMVSMSPPPGSPPKQTRSPTNAKALLACSSLSEQTPTRLVCSAGSSPVSPKAASLPVPSVLPLTRAQRSTKAQGSRAKVGWVPSLPQTGNEDGSSLRGVSLGSLNSVSFPSKEQSGEGGLVHIQPPRPMWRRDHTDHMAPAFLARSCLLCAFTL